MITILEIINQAKLKWPDVLAINITEIETNTWIDGIIESNFSIDFCAIMRNKKPLSIRESKTLAELSDRIKEEK